MTPEEYMQSDDVTTVPDITPDQYMGVQEEQGITPEQYMQADDTVPQPVEPQEEDTQFMSEHPNLWAAGKAIADIPQGLGEITEKVASGMTLGLSDKVGQAGEYLAEKVTGKKVEKKESVLQPWVATTAEFAGAFAPVSAANKLVAMPIIKALSKNKEITALKKMIGAFGAGSAVATTEKLIKDGELPSPKDVVEEGAMWAAFEGVLHGAGKGGQFASAIVKIAKNQQIRKIDALKMVMREAKSKKIPLLEHAKDSAKMFDPADELLTIAENLGKKETGMPLLKPDGTFVKSKPAKKIEATPGGKVEQIPYTKQKVPLLPHQKATLENRMVKGKEKPLPLIKPDTTYHKSTKPRSVSQILKDVNSAIGKRGAIGSKAISGEQRAAIERITSDAKIAGKTISVFLKEAGATPQAIEREVEMQKTL